MTTRWLPLALITLWLLGAVTDGAAQTRETGREFVPPPDLPDQSSALAPSSDAASVAPSAQSARYELSDFLAIAARNNPTIRQAQLQISAQTARALQAGLYPNPMLRYMGEQIGIDVPGNTDSPGEFQGMTLQQRFVTAGKLRLSREKYLRRADVSEHLAMAQQFRVCNDVRIHFYRTLAAAEIVELRRELLKSAEDGAVTVRELYNAGQATRPDVRRSNIALQQARLDLFTAESDFRQRFRQLSSLVGVDLAAGPVEGTLVPNSDPISYDEALDELLTASPELMAARAKFAADRVTLQRENVEWIPDIVAQGGAGYNFEAKETTAAAGIGIELPVYDRNQGTIRQARLDLARQREEIRRTELDLKMRLADAYRQYATAYRIAGEYRDVIIPEAELAYRELLESYREDRVDWPQVLSAQRDYFQSRITGIHHARRARTHEVLVRGYLLHGGLVAAAGPAPPGHIDAVPKPR